MDNRVFPHPQVLRPFRHIGARPVAQSQGEPSIVEGGAHLFHEEGDLGTAALPQDFAGPFRAKHARAAQTCAKAIRMSRRFSWVLKISGMVFIARS